MGLSISKCSTQSCHDEPAYLNRCTSLFCFLKETFYRSTDPLQPQPLGKSLVFAGKEGAHWFPFQLSAYIWWVQTCQSAAGCGLNPGFNTKGEFLSLPWKTRSSCCSSLDLPLCWALQAAREESGSPVETSEPAGSEGPAVEEVCQGGRACCSAPAQVDLVVCDLASS